MYKVFQNFLEEDIFNIVDINEEDESIVAYLSCLFSNRIE